jgi:transposase
MPVPGPPVITDTISHGEAAKPAMAIDKGLAGPGLLAYIVTSKFADYLPLYRLEDIFVRQGFRDFASHAIGVVRRYSRSGRTPVGSDGGSSEGLSRGGH